MWGPCRNHMKTMWKPHENHVGDMCKPCANHLETTWKPCGIHMKTTWGSSVLVIPNPKTKPGLPAEIWLACQHMVIKECHLQGGNCLLHKCIFSPAWFACFCLNSCKSCQYLLNSCTWDGWMDAMDRIGWMGWKPCGNHIETMWGPCGNHIKTMWGTCADHVQTMCKPFGNHMKTMSGPCGNHMKKCWGHVQTMHNPDGNHMEILWGGSVLVVPNPKSQDQTRASRWIPRHVQTMCNHVHSTWNHVGAMWKPHANHVGEKPGGDMSDHVQTMWKPHENHGAMWKPHEKHCGGHGQA